jgi:hypothetical protein
MNYILRALLPFALISPHHPGHQVAYPASFILSGEVYDTCQISLNDISWLLFPKT